MKQRKDDLVYQRRSKTDKRVIAGVRSLQALARGRRARSIKPASSIVSDIMCSECEYKPAVKRCLNCQDYFCFLCFENFHYKGNRTSHQYESMLREEPLLLRSLSGVGSAEENMIGGASSVGRDPLINERSIESQISGYVANNAWQSNYPNAESVDGLSYNEWNYDVSSDAHNLGETAAFGDGTMAYPADQTDDNQFGYDEYYAAEGQEWLDPNVYWQEYFDEGAQAKYWFNTWTGEATWVYPFSTEEA